MAKKEKMENSVEMEEMGEEEEIVLVKDKMEQMGGMEEMGEMLWEVSIGEI